MATENADFTQLTATQQAAIEKCEHVVEEYRRKQLTRAAAVRTLTAAVSTQETGLDNAAADTTLDSYLAQLDDADKIRTQAGEGLQQRFRGRDDGQHDASGGTVQDGQGQSHSQSTLQSRHPSELPGEPSPVAEKEGSRSTSYEPSSDGHRDKRRKPDPSKFAWTALEVAADELLKPELRATLKYLREYGKDVKFSKSNLINSAGAPEFPDAEWTNILSGHAVDLDHVLSNIYALSSDDKHIKHLGNVEL